MDATEDVVVLKEIKRYEEVGEPAEENSQIIEEKVCISYDLTSMSDDEKKKFFETKYDIWGVPLHDIRDDDEMPTLEECKDEDEEKRDNKT